MRAATSACKLATDDPSLEPDCNDKENELTDEDLPRSDYQYIRRGATESPLDRYREVSGTRSFASRFIEHRQKTKGVLKPNQYPHF